MLESLIRIQLEYFKRQSGRLIPALILCVLCSPGMMTAQAENPVFSITQAELRDQISFLASDELEGRDTGSRGYAIAALYAVTQFKMSGIEPLITDKKGIKSYFQSVPFFSYDIGEKSVFTIGANDTVTSLFHTGSMVLFRSPSLNTCLFVDEHPVFLGYGIDDPEIGWSDYAHVDVKGKVIVMCGGAPSRDGNPVFPADKDSFYRNFGRSANARVISAVKHGVSALVFVPDPQMAKNWAALSSSMARRQFVLPLENNRRIDFPAIIFMHPDALTTMLDHAGYEWTYGDEKYKSAVLENIKVSCSIERVHEEEISCKNIVALLPGTDPQLREEYIVLHAHLDHLGINKRGQVMNGADDDASGCAAVLEVAEALSLRPAKRSFIFVLFTGEEKGTLGSHWFVNNLPVPQGRIVFNAAVDMIGRKSNQKPDVIYVVADGAGKEDLINIAKRVNDARIQAAVDFSLNKNDPDGHIMRCDLQPFLSKNITSLLFTRGFMPPVYHNPRDDAETLNYDKIEKAARLLYLVLSEAGNKVESSEPEGAEMKASSVIFEF